MADKPKDHTGLMGCKCAYCIAHPPQPALDRDYDHGYYG